MYLPVVPYIYVYMIQQVEYMPTPFMDWAGRVPNYTKVMHRQKLILSKKAIMILIYSYAFYLVGLIIVILLFINLEILLAVLLFAWLPVFIMLSLGLLLAVIRKPLEISRVKQIKQAKNILKNHKAKKIAIMGSFGKTTLKELLAQSLAQSYEVKSTPGNKNVLISHARWICQEIDGSEEYIIFEFGEYRAGDIAKMAELVKPDYVIMTGYAPNHLDSYGSIDALKKDFLSIKKAVPSSHIFASKQAEDELKFGLPLSNIYSLNQALGRNLSNIKNSYEGISFDVTNKKNKIMLTSQLIGKHLAPVIAFVYAFSLLQDVDKDKLVKQLADTKPYDHRLSLTNINGAWIIDDTYNGNIEGIKAGLELLKDLPASKKIYVTPGLVEQGSEKEVVHKKIAQMIIDASPNEVVLMKNSSTKIIKDELEGRYNNKLTIIDDPLGYYKSLPYRAAGGSLFLLQNDWTDNYN